MALNKLTVHGKIKGGRLMIIFTERCGAASVKHLFELDSEGAVDLANEIKSLVQDYDLTRNL